MVLDFKNVEISLDKGLDTKSDPIAVAPSSALLEADNIVYDKLGATKSRNGFSETALMHVDSQHSMTNPKLFGTMNGQEALVGELAKSAANNDGFNGSRLMINNGGYLQPIARLSNPKIELKKYHENPTPTATPGYSCGTAYDATTGYLANMRFDGTSYWLDIMNSDMEKVCSRYVADKVGNFLGYGTYDVSDCAGVIRVTNSTGNQVWLIMLFVVHSHGSTSIQLFPVKILIYDNAPIQPRTLYSAELQATSFIALGDSIIGCNIGHCVIPYNATQKYAGATGDQVWISYIDYDVTHTLYKHKIKIYDYGMVGSLGSIDYSSGTAYGDSLYNSLTGSYDGTIKPQTFLSRCYDERASTIGYRIVWMYTRLAHSPTGSYDDKILYCTVFKPDGTHIAYDTAGTNAPTSVIARTSVPHDDDLDFVSASACEYPYFHAINNAQKTTYSWFVVLAHMYHRVDIRHTIGAGGTEWWDNKFPCGFTTYIALSFDRHDDGSGEIRNHSYACNQVVSGMPLSPAFARNKIPHVIMGTPSIVSPSTMHMVDYGSAYLMSMDYGFKLVHDPAHSTAYIPDLPSSIDSPSFVSSHSTEAGYLHIDVQGLILNGDVAETRTFISVGKNISQPVFLPSIAWNGTTGYFPIQRVVTTQNFESYYNSITAIYSFEICKLTYAWEIGTTKNYSTSLIAGTTIDGMRPGFISPPSLCGVIDVWPTGSDFLEGDVLQYVATYKFIRSNGDEEESALSNVYTYTITAPLVGHQLSIISSPAVGPFGEFKKVIGRLYRNRNNAGYILIDENVVSVDNGTTLISPLNYGRHYGLNRAGGLDAGTSSEKTGIPYSLGGDSELEHEPPFQFGAVEIFQNRIFYSHGSRIYFSQDKIPGQAFCFSSLLYIDTPIEVKALTEQDGRLLVWGSNAIGIISGICPDRAGNGGSLQYNDLPLTCGIRDITQICKSDSGMIFKSNEAPGYNGGYYILGRDLNLEYIGAPIEAYNSEQLIDMAYDPQHRTLWVNLANPQNQLYSNHGLIFNANLNMWSTWSSNLNAYKSIMDDSQLVRLGPAYTSGEQKVPIQKYQYSRDQLGGTYYSLTKTASTPHIRIGAVTGFQRVNWIHVRGNYLSPHSLAIEIKNDINGDVQTETFTVSSDPTEYHFRIAPKYPLSTVCKIKCTITPTSDSPYTGAEISVIGFEIGVKRGLRKIIGARTK